MLRMTQRLELAHPFGRPLRKPARHPECLGEKPAEPPFLLLDRDRPKAGIPADADERAKVDIGREILLAGALEQIRVHAVSVIGAQRSGRP